MITYFTHKRGADTFCLLVTYSGEIHYFQGESIPDVCHASRIPSPEFRSDAWELIHPERVSVVIWDNADHHPFTQRTWESGFFWLATRAPMASRESFEAFIRRWYSCVASHWDKARFYEHEFGFPATEEEAQKLRADKERAKLEAEFGCRATPAELAAMQSARVRIAREALEYELALRECLERSPFTIKETP